MKASRAIRFARIGSTDFLAHPSLLVAGVVLVLLFSPRFDRGGADPYLVGVVFVVALYAAVLAHELAHVVAARLCGLQVPSVTLHVLGGATAISGTVRTPLTEAFTAVVGPVASALVGLAAFWAGGHTDDPTGQQVLWSLGWINLLIALFNLLPGLPLDGGRVLAAAGWALTGRPSSGVHAAVWAGRGSAVLVVAVGIWLATTLPRGLFDLVVAVVVAGFLWAGSTEALRETARSRNEPPSDERRDGETGRSSR